MPQDRILITNKFRKEEGHSYFPANAVQAEINGHIVERHVFPQLEDWDPEALNQLNQKGAIVYSPDWKAIDAQAEDFKSRYPHLPIHCNPERP